MLATMPVGGRLVRQPMRKLTSIAVCTALVVILGHVGNEHREAIEAGNRRFPPAWEKEPGRVLGRACANCHSDHTEWPWYSRVAPVSWWITQHVREGRRNLDFSEWERYSAGQKRDKLESICGVITTGRMPPQLYTFMHPEAKVTEKDKDTVCDWVKTETIRAR